MRPDSYTLAPVPGAICHAGGRPVLVGCSPTSFQLELASLKEAQQSSGARHLLLCYMRGKLPADLDLLLSWCKVMQYVWTGQENRYIKSDIKSDFVILQSFVVLTVSCLRSMLYISLLHAAVQFMLGSVCRRRV